MIPPELPASTSQKTVLRWRRCCRRFEIWQRPRFVRRFRNLRKNSPDEVPQHRVGLGFVVPERDEAFRDIGRDRDVGPALVVTLENAIPDVEDRALEMGRGQMMITDEPVVVQVVNGNRSPFGSGTWRTLWNRVTLSFRPEASGTATASGSAIVQPCAGRQRSGR